MGRCHFGRYFALLDGRNRRGLADGLLLLGIEARKCAFVGNENMKIQELTGVGKVFLTFEILVGVEGGIILLLAVDVALPQRPADVLAAHRTWTSAARLH